MEYCYINVRINSFNICLYISCKNFVNVGPVTSELAHFLWIVGTTRQELMHIQPNISGYTVPILTIFSLCIEMIDLDFFTICQGSLPWQPINFGIKQWTSTDVLVFFTWIHSNFTSLSSEVTINADVLTVAAYDPVDDVACWRLVNR